MATAYAQCAALWLGRYVILNIPRDKVPKSWYGKNLEGEGQLYGED